MTKTAMIRARVEPRIKQDAEKIFSTLGLSATEAITLFYRQVVLCRGLPFEVRVPNAETRKALRQTKTAKGLIHYREIVDDLLAEIDE